MREGAAADIAIAAGLAYDRAHNSKRDKAEWSIA
jgi:hypothetical protein